MQLRSGLWKAVALVALVAETARAATCSAAVGDYCGNADGTTCCPDGSYCQPWNEYYYQCVAVPDGCSALETDVDFYGNDLSSVQTTYPWTCCELCQETSGCTAYTFWNQDPSGPTCYLKTSGSGKATKSGAVSGTVTKTTTAPTTAPTTCAAQGEYCGSATSTSCCASGSYCQPWDEYYYQCIGVADGCGSMQTDVDLYGNDIKSVQTTYPWTCCELCQETSGCVAYTFWNQDPSGPTCYLKSSASGKVTKTGAVSGVVTSTPTPTPTPSSAPLVCGDQLANIYYHGFDISTSNVTTAAACCVLCASNPSCVLYTHFISTTTGQHTCYLKSAAGEKTNYADSSSVEAVSAFMVSSTSAPTAAPTPSPTPTPTTNDNSLCGTPIQNVMYNDYTLYEFELETAAECCEYCAVEFDDCVLYSFYAQPSTGTYRCLLKSAAGSTTTYAAASGVTVQSAFIKGYTTPTPTPASTPTPTPTPSSSCVAVGGNCGSATSTSCCASGSYCQPWNDYYYQCVAVPTGCSSLETNVDYYGNDIKSVQTAYPWTCCELCRETSGCVAYTFWNQDPSGPTCYLKSSKTGKVTKSGAVSGSVTA